MNKEFDSTSNLFPPISPKQEEGDLLWSNVNTFAIPDDDKDQSETSTISSSPFPALRFNPVTTAHSSSLPTAADNKEDPTAFNISWGGDDKPPSELHPDSVQEEEMKPTRPLPKPRGIRKLPEPDPLPDGTIDEDTLKRRKNTDAARRSRMKKFMKVDQLENKVNTLQAENAKLILNNAVLESEKRGLHAKEIEYKKRIKYLEDILICNGWVFNSNSTDQP